MRRRGAKSFVDDLVLSRGVVLSRADLFCDLLRLSPMTRRFVRFRRTYLLRDDVETSCASQTATAGDGCKTVGGCGYFAQRRENRCRTANFTSPYNGRLRCRAGGRTLPLASIRSFLLSLLKCRTANFTLKKITTDVGCRTANFTLKKATNVECRTANFTLKISQDLDAGKRRE